MRNQLVFAVAITAVFAFRLPATPVLGKGFTLSDTALMSFDQHYGWGDATITNRRDVPGPGVEFDIHFPGNEQPDSVLHYGSSKDGSAGSLVGIDVSMYDAFELKFTLVSIDGVSTPDIGGLVSVGAAINPWHGEGSGEAYRPAWIDLVSDTPYDSTSISSTTIDTDQIFYIGIIAWLFEPSDWSPSGTNMTLLVEAAPSAVVIPETGTVLLLGLGGLALLRKYRPK